MVVLQLCSSYIHYYGKPDNVYFSLNLQFINIVHLYMYIYFYLQASFSKGLQA